MCASDCVCVCVCVCIALLCVCLCVINIILHKCSIRASIPSTHVFIGSFFLYFSLSLSLLLHFPLHNLCAVSCSVTASVSAVTMNVLRNVVGLLLAELLDRTPLKIWHTRIHAHIFASWWQWLLAQSRWFSRLILESIEALKKAFIIFGVITASLPKFHEQKL